jgi:glycosyltransferase involved in cell wall biosynthesis
MSKRLHKVLFITIVPSPYQRDLFAALAEREEVQLEVCYLDIDTPENPWPAKPLASYERIMPGVAIRLGGARVHMNWRLPDVGGYDLIVLCSFTSITGQWLMNVELPNKRWLFWGEILHTNVGVKRFLQERLAHPISRSCGVVAIGSKAEEDYRRRFPDVEHFCIPYHCDLTEFLLAPRPRPARKETVFLFCGQMIERKGIDVLLLAFEQLIAEGIGARLLLVGREAELNRFLGGIHADARARIEYCGFQTEALPQYFAQGDVFVLPSRYDGWGVVINQALAAGMPIISTHSVGAALDLVTDGKNGILVGAGSVSELHAAMARLATNPALLSEWGENSRVIAHSVTPSAGAAKWISVFDRIQRAQAGLREVE